MTTFRNKGTLVELRDMAISPNDISIFKTTPNNDYNVGFQFQNENIVIVVSPATKGEKIKGKEFLVQIDYPRVGFYNDQLAYVKDEDKTLVAPEDDFDSEDEEDAESMGIVLGTAAAYGA